MLDQWGAPVQAGWSWRAPTPWTTQSFSQTISPQVWMYLIFPLNFPLKKKSIKSIFEQWQYFDMFVVIVAVLKSLCINFYLSSLQTFELQQSCSGTFLYKLFLVLIPSPPLRYWRVGVQAVCQTLQRDFRPEGLWPLSWSWSPAWSSGPIRRRHWCFCPPKGRHCLPSILHMQDGLALWPDGGGWLKRTRSGPGEASCDRRLDHAQHCQWKPECSNHHDGREDCWYYQRSPCTRWIGGSCVPASNTWHTEIKREVYSLSVS